MGAPDDPSEFVRCQADDLTFYVARELLDKLEPGDDKLLFYVDGYGRFWLRLNSMPEGQVPR